MSENKEYFMNKKLQKELNNISCNCILQGYRGSLAHNTYNKEWEIDDIDVWGIAIAPIKHYLGLKYLFKDRFYDGTVDQIERKVDEYDILIYDIRKYMRLLIKNNPNVITWLWVRENHYIKKTKLGQRLLDNRDLFISKDCYKSFTGYAYGQLKKMESFAKEGYMGEKRKQLVKKHGYDTKNASHLIRLLKMGIELLSTGKLNVFREDAPYLIDIKQGKYSLDYIKKEAKRLFDLAEEAYVRSNLPDRVNKEKAEGLLLDIIKDYFQ